MYSDTSWLGRIGLEDNPTTAIVLLSLNIFVIGSPSPRPPISAPPGMCTLMAWPLVFPLPHLLPLSPLPPEISLSSRGQFTLARALQNHPRHGRQTLVIFFRGSHRNAQRFRIRPYHHKHKIRLARRWPESQLRQSLAQPFPLRCIRLNAARHVLVVIQRRERRSLRHA